VSSWSDAARALLDLQRPIATRRRRDAVAVVAGAAGVLAFPPFALWPLAAVAPALLFLLWHECRPGRAAWRGWLFGLGYWGAGVYWIYFSLHHFGSAVAPLSGVLTLLFVAGLALTLAALGALVGLVAPERRGPLWCLTVLPGAWVLLEWVRSWLLTGFPWLLLGTSQIDSSLAGYLPVAGVFGTGLAVSLTAGALATLTWWRWREAAVAVAVIAVVWLGGFGLAGLRWTYSGAIPFDTALIQGNVAPERKFADLEASLSHYTGVTREAAGQAEVVVWPETAVPTFYEREAQRLNEFAREMHERDTHVVTGVFTFGEDGERYFNSVRQLGPANRPYNKQRLVPFGEYMPLRTWLGVFDRYIEIPMSDIAAGDAGQEPLQVGRYRMGASVCYEAAYPGVIASAVPPATVLVNVSNDAWFGRSAAPGQHLQMARVRSRELARPMLRATNTGISAVIDHRGDVQSRAALFEAATVEARVEPRGGLTPFARWGSLPALAVSALLVAGPVGWSVGRRRIGQGGSSNERAG
jgi:apolipoprotein N-acyltransferase